MLKVKQWVIDNFSEYEIISGDHPKDNGHTGVFIEAKYHIDKDNRFKIMINNETIVFQGIYQGKSLPGYAYLQTYEQLTRGEPDKNGYYARSTEDEVIKYLTEKLDLYRDISEHIPMKPFKEGYYYVG